MRILRSVFRLLVPVCLLYTSWLMVNLSIPYLQMKSNVDFLKTKELIYHIRHWRFSFYIHVFTATFVLVAGIFQFSRYIIQKQKMLHRVSGYIYVCGVLFITGPAAFIMAWYANGGVPARASFVTLATLWLFTTAIAWKQVLKRNFVDHGAWMLRSYALTVSAITLRTYAFLFGYFQIQVRPVHIYITIAWLSWIPNLVVAEIMIRKGFVSYLLRPEQKQTPLIHR